MPRINKINKNHTLIKIKIVVGLVLMMCLMTGISLADGSIWYCPECGRRNEGNFCPNDGVAKPSDLGQNANPNIGKREDQLPVDLTNLTPYYEGTVQIFTKQIRDTMGNTYESGLRGYMEPGTENSYLMWDIGGKYTALTATCIIREKDKGSKYTGSFRIFGDNVLLYEQDNIGSETKPFSLSVDISQVKDLKIEMYGNGNAGTSGINSVLVDVMLVP